MNIFRRRETPADDNARTNLLLDGLEAAYEERRQGLDLPLTQFEEVVLDATVTLSGEPYPPAGHTYPKRDCMEPTLYSLVLGPRGGEESSLDRALAANVVDARSCALRRDSEGEAMAHQEINKLLDLREKGI